MVWKLAPVGSRGKFHVQGFRGTKSPKDEDILKYKCLKNSLTIFVCPPKNSLPGAQGDKVS